ncbi:outer membrane beta-barrel protein [Mucilaginibacter celer]|uniref:TonB-dependent receptor n=1 Tax=Mucilaginibacter celer TaxID=2305508 RepID=A0A494VUN5_9SPHI|nr:outer membrane beta-barrel protein [Mucilaginibacter celer]AYL97190.1 TonB-dependent receptor [Mucilaginibacter celer]
MNFLTRSFFIAFLTGLYCVAYAQTKAPVIQGKVFTDSHQPAEAATVILFKVNAPDTSILRSGIVNPSGVFEFTDLKPGTYLVQASQIGYSKIYSGPHHLTAGQTLTTPDIVLKPSNQQLQEVKVVARKPRIEVKPGKITLSIQNSILAEGNSAFDILRQSPGVRVNSNETLSVTGRQPAMVLIDGRPTNLSGDDLATMLRSMQSSTIDQIEVISSPSAKYDASGGGVINIILKKGKNLGTNGTITAMAGYGKYYKSTVGIVFNHRDKNLNIFGNYTFDANKSARTINTRRSILFDDVLSNYNVDYNNIQTTRNHNFKLGADYTINPKQTIGFLIFGIVREDDFTKHNNLKIINRGKLDSMINARSNLDRGSSYLNYNINYNAKLDSSGKSLSADANYSTNHRHSNEYITNTFLTPQGNSYRDDLDLENLSPAKIHIWTAKVDYVNPLTKTSKLEAGAKYSHVNSDNDLVFGPKVNGSYQPDVRFSNRFLYKETVSAAYLNYLNKIGAWDITAGVRAENTSTSGSSWAINQVTPRVNTNSYFNVFPQVQVNYDVDKKNTLGVGYNRGIHRPMYEDINPFLYYTDLYDYRAGNPNLKPEFTNTIQLSHTYNQSISTQIYYSITNDAYDFPVYLQNDSSKVNITIRNNFGQVFTYGASFYAPAQITKWWNADFNVDAMYVRYKAYARYGNFNRAKQDIILSTTQTFSITGTTTAEILGRYETPTIYGVNNLKSSYSVNVGISRQILNKLGTLKLTVMDIFNTDRVRNYAIYQNINLSETSKRDTRIVRLNFSYRFGKSTVKSATKRNTGNDDERRRTGN